MSPQSRKIKSTLAAALAVGAVAPAAASAMPPPPDPPPSHHPVVFVEPSPQSGFDWGDAGIGAAGGLGLSLIAVGGGVLIARRHARHAQIPTPAAG
jgi:hypothetical protein